MVIQTLPGVALCRGMNHTGFLKGEIRDAGRCVLGQGGGSINNPGLGLTPRSSMLPGPALTCSCGSKVFPATEGGSGGTQPAGMVAFAQRHHIPPAD